MEKERKKEGERVRERERKGEEGSENERASQTGTLNEEKSLCVCGMNCTSVSITHYFYFITFTSLC